MIRDILNELVDKTTRSRDYPSDAINTALSEIKKEVLGAIPKTISDKVIMGYGNMDSKLEVEARNDAITDTRKALEGVFK